MITSRTMFYVEFNFPLKIRILQMIQQKRVYQCYFFFHSDYWNDLSRYDLVSKWMVLVIVIFRLILLIESTDVSPAIITRTPSSVWEKLKFWIQLTISNNSRESLCNRCGIVKLFRKLTVSSCSDDLIRKLRYIMFFAK